MAGRVSSPRFVGRVAELASLNEAVSRLGTGETVAVMVGGEAGAGKSRLLGEMAKAAAAGGARVIAGACVALAAESLPYAPFSQALGELTADLGPGGVEDLVGAAARADVARLVPELRLPGDEARPAGASDRAVLFGAVLRILEAVAEEAPLVVVIEDLHWADASSRELLAFLAGRLRGSVLVVATYRSDELHRRHPLRPLLAEAARNERIERLELGPLDPGEVAEQLEAILGSPPPAAIVAAVVQRAEGNPFFAEELLAAGAGPELPPGLADVLAARLAALPEASFELVRVAAVAGRRVGHDLLAAVCGRDAADLVAGLREATFHHVLVADADGAYAFRHALLQEAAYGELLPGERVSLHAAYAAALAANPEWAASPAGAAGELAHHYAAARDPARALGASVVAAGAAVDSYALGEAHALYEQALALWDQVPEAAALAGCDRAQLLERCTDAAMLAGATRRAIALVRSAIEALDPSREPVRAALLHWRLARLLWTSGEGEASLSANHAAVALMPTEPTAERALILAAEAHVLMLSARYQESRGICEEAIAVARTAGARREEGYALNTLGGCLSCLGEPDAAVDRLERALEIAEDVGSIEDVWRAYANLAVVLFDVGRLERSAAVGRAGVARIEALGYEEGAASLRCVTADTLAELGAWAEADRLAAEALTGPVSAHTGWMVREVRGKIAVRRGDYGAAHALLDDMPDTWRTGYDQFRADLDALLIELALGEGRLEALRALVDEGIDALAGSDAQDHLQRLVALGLRAEAEEVCRRQGRGETRARVALARAEALIERSNAMSAELAQRAVPLTWRSEVLRGLCEAEMDRIEGRHEPAMWGHTADEWARFPQPYDSAYARWRQAEAYLGADEREPAARALREAFALAGSLGAAPLSTAIEALARRARVRLGGAADEREADDASRSGLSRREVEVLALVAAGHTNREIAGLLFISDKTASAHVSHILTKLGVSNRGQATALAHRLNLVPAPPPA